MRGGTESIERKEWAQMPVDVRHRNLYLEWETAGAPYREGEIECVMIRKKLIKEGDN